MNCLPFCGNHRRQLFKKRVEISDKLKRLRCSFLWPNNSLVKFPYLISAAIIEGSTCVRVPPMERRHGCVLSANPRLLSFPSSRARRSIAQSQLGLRLKNSGFKRLRRSTRDVATFCKRLAWIPHSRRRSYPMTRLLPLPFQPRPRIRRSFQVRLLLELQPMIFLSSVPRGAAFYCSLTPRLSQSAKRVGCPLACNTGRLPIREICQGVLIFRESSGLPI
jgi:hypothetical protein